MAAGQSIGAIAGGVLGNTVAPGIGGALGSQIGQTAGGLIDSAVSGRRANQLSPGLVDPLEQQRMNELNQIRKNISTGSDVATQAAIGEAQEAGATTQGRIARSTGGDVGGTVNALLKAQRGTQAATNQAIAQGQQRLPIVEQLAQQLGTRLSQRKLELNLLAQNRQAARAAQAGTDAAQNLSALAALQGSLPSQGSEMVGVSTEASGPMSATDFSGIVQGVSGLLGGGANAGAPPLATPGINPNAGQTLPGVGLKLDDGFVTPTEPAINIPNLGGIVQ